MNGKREFGDYQTPLDFAAKICRYLRDERNITPSMVIEPTCGIGNFLSSSLIFEADKYYGIEINSDYCDECIFPLIKSSMFKTPIITDFKKYVIVTQKKVREETSHIQRDFPKAWEYLNRNITYFSSRKSSIYRNAPAFSMFGIGDYSYSK